MYQIYQGIPIPEKRTRKDLKSKLGRLKINECLWIELEKEAYERTKSAVHLYARLNNKKFSMRTLPNKKCGIWRIA